MPFRIEPAVMAFDATGTPFSPRFGDIYHTAASGTGQARHVFLSGNGLPERWAKRSTFTIVELGFGLGLNFLATWQAWRAGRGRCDRLFFVSVEKHPFTAADLIHIHKRHPEFAEESAQMLARWPPLIPGMHRLSFEDDRLHLILVWADAKSALGQLRVRADAFFLDGFAPAKNPDLWSPSLMRSLARLANAGATAATYTTARAARDALESAGFVVERRSGFGHKREMLVARFAPRWPRPSSSSWSSSSPKRVGLERQALIVGAGLAGVSVAQALVGRGWRVELCESRGGFKSDASPFHAGAFYPHLSKDDARLSRLSRAGLSAAIPHWRALEAHEPSLAWQCCGVLDLSLSAADEARRIETITALGLPSDYAAAITREDASELAGRRLSHGGFWFPEGGWIAPRSLGKAQLTALGQWRGAFTLHCNARVERLLWTGASWRALDAHGATLAEASVAIVANACDASRLFDFGPAELAPIRGQLSYLSAAQFAGPRVVVCGDGYVLPSVDGTTVIGATYDRDDRDPHPRASDHAANLARLQRLFDDLDEGPAIDHVTGAVGFRCVARDRLPLIGKVANVMAARECEHDLRGAHLGDLPRLPALYSAIGYGSRGLTWATLGADIIACDLEGDPAPIEIDLLNAVDPGRFILRELRRAAA